jgi:uncharacterized protein (TIGR03437 family)
MKIASTGGGFQEIPEQKEAGLVHVIHGGAMKRAYLRGLLFLAVVSTLFGQTSAGGPVITGVSNNASGAPAIESGSWVSIYGSGLSATTRSWQASDFSGNSLPTMLDNVSVQINGKKAAIAYVSSGQLNVQAPTDTTTGPVQVQVNNSAGTATGTATLQNYSPAFFTFQGQYAAALHNTDGVYVAPAGYLGSAVTAQPAQPGETLQIYATGFGPTAPAVPAGQLVGSPALLSDLTQLHVTIGGMPATVQFAGIVAPGLYQINAIVPQLPNGDQPILATIAGVSSQTGVSIPILNWVGPPATVTLTPAGGTIRCGATLSFTAKLANTTNQAVIWLVNGQAGGSPTVGTVSATGVYAAPAVLPNPAAVTVTAVSQADPAAEASVTMNLQNPLPVVASVTPNPVNPGNVTITVSGTGFANKATVYFAGAALPTVFVSDTQLTATGTVAMPVGRLAAVKVTNPNPGTATSTPIAVPIRLAVENMPYADAVRFLQMTTWGPTPQSVVDIQTMGMNAWLAAQFAMPASAWPDPDSTTEGVARLQTAFFNVAINGTDQLRQRASFALAQILVASAIKNTAFEQMVGYQRLMGDYAFGTYHDLLAATTLDPSMGYFLDMVNNAKANPAAGTSANENYARESMQLFSLGLVQLDSTGVPISSGGATVPEYGEADVQQMAKVMTGWTYGETPGFASLWTNMPYYFLPMVAFESYHDTTQKTINMPLPCVIPAGGTAESDLSAAVDCICQQSNVAPFVSYRLIQRFVLSDPSPAYVGRVASAFQSSQGNLQTVITTLLTDSEAQSEGTGKLAEPILYATGLLRALNTTVTTATALTNQATLMGQIPLTPGSVFSYFSPFYRVPGLTPPPVAPEFQALNAATALARANFAYLVATNGVSGSITVNLANLQDLANNPPDLVEALNQALYRGEMGADVRGLLTTAASSSTSLASRVRSALYAAAAAPQYEIER